MKKKNRGRSILDLQEHNLGYDNVYKDGSSDETVNITRRIGFPVILHYINIGSSNGTGENYFLYAHQNDYDIVCQFDGDGQHKSKDFQSLITPIIEDEADFAFDNQILKKPKYSKYCD